MAGNYNIYSVLVTMLNVPILDYSHNMYVKNLVNSIS